MQNICESLEKYRDATLTELRKTAKLDGFRTGKVPQDQSFRSTAKRRSCVLRRRMR